MIREYMLRDRLVLKNALVMLAFVLAGIGILTFFVTRVPAWEHDEQVSSDDRFSTSWDRIDFRHDLFTAVLSNYVNEEGLVDYDGIQSDPRFREYLYRLANTDPAKLGDEKARLAFWMNAYNVFAIQGVLETIPPDRNDWSRFRVIDVQVPEVRQSGKGFFIGLRFIVGGHWVTLDEIEKGFLLQRSEWLKKDRSRYRSMGVTTPDPRIHFALVCAAKGCVKLRREAYEAATVDEQLDRAVRGFLGDRTRIRFDPARKMIHTSELLKWYQHDFTNPKFKLHAASLPAFLSKFVDDQELSRSLAQDRWIISYFDYDWKLNLRP